MEIVNITISFENGNFHLAHKGYGKNSDLIHRFFYEYVSNVVSDYIKFLEVKNNESNSIR